MNSLYSQLSNQFTNLEFKKDQVLAKYTTVKIGGKAEVFCETKTSLEFSSLVTYAIKNNINLTILGFGANTLISDRGIKGLVVRNTARNIKILDKKVKQSKKTVKNIVYRWQSDKTKGSFKYEFDDLDYDESSKPMVLVEIDSGVILSYAINYLIDKGITGLQWYSRIPASLGGAIYNNIHGGTHFISEVIESVTVIDQHGEIKTISNQNLRAGYDTSRFHTSKEIIVKAQLRLYKGDKNKAKFVSKNWAIRKSLQPQKSLGCVFKNLSNSQKEKLKLPTNSIGYIIEHILNKKGYRIGDARVSLKHAAFIENLGKAEAEDYLKIIRVIIKETKEKIGIILKPEIFFLGFKKSELKGIKY